MNKSDQQFVQELGAQLGGEGIRWRVLTRAGIVLMLLVDGRSLPVALGLYAPQKGLAKLMVGVLKKISLSRHFMPAVSLDWSEGSPMEQVQKDLKGDLRGVLLGNPTQKHRRALALVESGSNQPPLVVKVGTTASAVEKIEHEISVLRELASLSPAVPGIPSLEACWNEDHFSAFAVPFFVNRAENFVQSDVLSLLDGWLDQSENITIEKSVEWTVLEATTLSGEELLKCRDLVLRRSVRHGDFAPWNLSFDCDASLVAIDWETGVAGDVPGWDLVHFLWVQADLVDCMAPVDVLKKVMGLLRSDEEIGAYLKRCGWASNEGLLLKTYVLVYSEFWNGKESFDEVHKKLSSI